MAGGFSWPALEASGAFTLGYGDHAAGTRAYLKGDATLGLSLGPARFELGVFGFATRDDTPHETYGTVSFALGERGRLWAGVPRPAYDLVLGSSLEDSFPLLGLDRVPTSRSHATTSTMFGYALPVGVLYRNGALAVSAHVAGNEDTRMASASLTHPVGATTLAAAIEIVDGPFGTKVNAKGGFETVWQDWSVAAAVFLPGSTPSPQTVELALRWRSNEDLGLDAVIHAPLEGGLDPVAGFSARYNLGDAARLRAGVATDGSGGMAFNAGLKWSF